MQKRLREFINVLPQEQELVILMILQSFLFGAGNNFIQTAAFTLFLGAFPPQTLPYTYIVVAFVVTGVAFAYLKLGERISFFSLLLVNISFLIFLSLIFQFGLYSGISKSVAFALPVFFQIQVNFVNLAFWGLASRIYNVQQGKRLFGLIGSGLWIGIILTGFTMSYFVSWAGVNNLLWFGAISMILSLLSMYMILNRHGKALKAPPEVLPQQRSTTRPSLFKNRYYVLIFALIFVWWIAFFFIDMLFYDRANARFTDANQLAGFIGSFLGYLGIFTWSLNTFFSAPVINKFGQRATLLILPVLILVGTAGLVLITFLNPGVSLLFYAMAVIKLVDLGVGFSIDRTALTVLYQPLALKIRNRFQTVAEGIVQPIAIGGSGLMLIALSNYLRLETDQLYVVLLLLTIVWIIIAVSLGREYPRMILKALDNHILKGDGSLILTPSIVEHLQKGLKSSNAGAVIYSLNLLESMDYPHLTREYLGLLDHPSEQVKIEILKRVEGSRLVDLIPEIQMHLREFAGAARGQAINTIASLAVESSIPEISRYLEDPDPDVQRGALIGLLRSDHSGGKSSAREKLTMMVNAGTPADRLIAADVLRKVSFEDGPHLLQKLMSDPDLEVRRAGILASGEVKDQGLWPFVIQALDDPHLDYTAVHVLGEGGPQVSELVVPLFLEQDALQDEEKTVKIARILGRLGTPQALTALYEKLTHTFPNIRYQVLQSLLRNHWRPDSQQEKEVVNNLIQTEAAELAWSAAAEVDLESVDRADHLRNALSTHAKNTIERIFLALSMLHGDEVIKPVQHSLNGHMDETQQAYALEVLELTLSAGVRNLIIPVLKAMEPNDRLVSLRDQFPQEHLEAEARLANILARGEAVSGRWLHAVALYTVGSLGYGSLSHFAEESLRSPYPYIREAAIWILHMFEMTGSQEDIREQTGDLNLRVDEPAKNWFIAGKVEAPMLTTVEKVIILKTIDLFANTPDHVLVEVASLLEEIFVPAGQTLITKGDLGDSMYIIIGGKMKAHDEDTLLNYLEERDFFGEMALLDLEPRVASVTAVEDTTLLRLDQGPFFELMESRVEVARGIISVLTRYLRRSLKELREIQASNSS